MGKPPAKTATKELFITDKRMLELLEWCLSSGRVKSQLEFFNSIGARPGNSSQLKNGLQSFTVKHILNAAAVYGVDLNWLFGRTHKKMFLDDNPLSPLDQLKQAVSLIEKEFQTKKTG